jgi:hypothetical protein
MWYSFEYGGFRAKLAFDVDQDTAEDLRLVSQLASEKTPLDPNAPWRVNAWQLGFSIRVPTAALFQV